MFFVKAARLGSREQQEPSLDKPALSTAENLPELDKSKDEENTAGKSDGDIDPAMLAYMKLVQQKRQDETSLLTG